MGRLPRYLRRRTWLNGLPGTALSSLAAAAVIVLACFGVPLIVGGLGKDWPFVLVEVVIITALLIALLATFAFVVLSALSLAYHLVRDALRTRPPGIDLRGTDLQSRGISQANLAFADLRVANLQGICLEGADLEGADLRGADLRDANLRGANLRDADLRNARLEGADLVGAVLPDGRLQSIPGRLRGSNRRQDSSRIV